MVLNALPETLLAPTLALLRGIRKITITNDDTNHSTPVVSTVQHTAAQIFSFNNTNFYPDSGTKLSSQGATDNSTHTSRQIIAH